MFRSFKRKKININTVEIPDFGWIREINNSQVIEWVNPKETLFLSLHFFNIVPDLPTIQDIDFLRNFYREMLAAPGGGIIEVELVDLQGFTAVRTIFKIPQEPTGMTYVGSLTIPFAKYSFVAKIQAPEVGVTGMRDSVILDKHIREGDVSLEDDGIKGWFYDPYDTSIQEGVLMNKSEQVQYDEMFPEHPLSQTRRLLAQIEHEISFGDELQDIAKFDR